MDHDGERALLLRWREAPADPGLAVEGERILADCRRKVEGWLRKRIDEQTASELAQEALTLAWSRLDAWEGRGRYGTWVIGFAKHLLWSRWRRAGREDLTADGLVPEASEPATALSRLTQEERESLLYEVVGEGLGELEQQIVALKYAEGMTHAAIAEQLGLDGPEHVTRLLKECRGELGVRLRAALRERGHGSSFWRTES